MLILIVDSSIEIIERFEELISESPNITAIHKALTYEDTLDLVAENKYGAVLLDIDMPGNESLELFKVIKNSAVETCVILLYNHPDNYSRNKCKSLRADFSFDKYYEFEKVRDLINSI